MTATRLVDFGEISKLLRDGPWPERIAVAEETKAAMVTLSGPPTPSVLEPARLVLGVPVHVDESVPVGLFRITERRPRTCPTTTPEPHDLGEFPMTCYRCHIEADS